MGNCVMLLDSLGLNRGAMPSIMSCAGDSVLNQKKPPPLSTKVVVLSSYRKGYCLDTGLKLLPNPSGTWKSRFSDLNINLFQQCWWHTDIKCHAMCCRCLCDFGFLLCAFSLGPFCGRFCFGSHCFFPFQKVLNKWTQRHSTAINIFQHFFVVAIGFRNVVTFGQMKGES